MFVARKSNHIQQDIARNWSSWNFGQEGVKANVIEEIEQFKKECKEADMPFSISGFELWGDEMDNADIRQLYPGYWVLVDERFDGQIAGIALKSASIEEAIKEANGGCFFGDGIAFDAQSAKLVHSNGDIHIFEL